MFRLLGKNLSTFFLALILAIGVWAAAVNASDPNEELTYPTPIPLEIVGQDPGLLITNAYSEQLQITLRAPYSVWDQLIANKDSIHAILDLSGLGAGEYSLEPQIQIGIQPTRLVSFLPLTVFITLEELVTRSIPIEVDIRGEPSVGYQAGSPRLTAVVATVSGAKSLVDRVDTLRASFDISDAREDIEENLSLEIVDEHGDVVRGVNLSPETIQLAIPISQQGGYRDVAVKVELTGQVASLYRLTGISVFPLVVTVYSSDTQLVNDLPGIIETEALDISGISENISARLKLILPENVVVVGDQSVLVEVSIEAIFGSLTISDKPLEIINLDPALAAELSSLTVDVILSGPLPALDTLSTDDLRIIVDASGLAAGTYQLTPLVEVLNDEIKVESILPESVEIIIGIAPPATPTTQP